MNSSIVEPIYLDSPEFWIDSGEVVPLTPNVRIFKNNGGGITIASDDMGDIPDIEASIGIPYPYIKKAIKALKDLRRELKENRMGQREFDKSKVATPRGD